MKQENILWDQAEQYIMNGTQLYSKMPRVNINNVSPKFFTKGKGTYAWDLEGRKYIDLTMGLGPCFVGYNHPAINKAIIDQLQKGIIFSLPDPLEMVAAETLTHIIPCAEKIRFLKTGSEATQAAVRIARAYTGRDMVLRGHYHGWHDWCMADTMKNKGIPRCQRNVVCEIQYNDLKGVQRLFDQYGSDIACVIIEPFELEKPENNYLGELKKICHDHGSLLLFDEIVTGFRFGLGGAQEYFGVTPDVATFGKGMAGGMPLSAVCGRAEIMDGAKKDIFVSSTFGGELLSLRCFLEVVDILREPSVIFNVFEKGNRLRDGFNRFADAYDVPVRCIGHGPRLGFDWSGVSLHQKALLMQEIVSRQVFFVWNMLPCIMLSDADVDDVLTVFDDALRIVSSAIDRRRVKTLLRGETPITVI